MTPNLLIRPMRRAEVDQLVEWAAREGWNPGLHDAEAFRANDPEAFMAADLDGELIGGGAITAYGKRFGFMGFFIIRPDFRGRGYGNHLWLARRDRLLARLDPGTSIGMDGVFEMEPYYARGGFVRSHRHIRFSGEIPPSMTRSDGTREEIVPLGEIPFRDLLEYDRTCFPAPRETFLRAWTDLPDSLALAGLRNGKLCGYGVIRRCRSGCRVGPLFADHPDLARALLGELSGFSVGGPLFLDVPDNNPDAMALAKSQGMTEVFGCARMYLGPPPTIDHMRLFGTTTLELG